MRTSSRLVVALIAVLTITISYFAFQTAQAQTGHMTQFPGVVGWYLGNVANGAVQAPRLQAMGERVTMQRVEEQASSLNLSDDAEAMLTEYTTGTGVRELTSSTRAHALASADFDEDGTPDLVGGYTSDAGGVITLQRGNVDAIYPNSPGARERRAQGQFTDAPFHRDASAFNVPEAAQFVGAGDFDADGHWDVVATRRGGRSLYFLRGDGQGKLAKPERIDLPAALTAFVTGEMNHQDGLTDIVVSVGGDAGAGVLVFESPAGALRGQPELLSLPTVASGLALGALDADAAANDLVIAAGNELLVVHGRDRRLSVDAESRVGVSEARVNRSAFEFTLAGVAVGDFAGDERADVAVLSTDGAVQVLTRAGGEKSAQAKTNAAQNHNAQATLGGDKAGGKIKWQRSERVSVGYAADAAEESATAVLLMTAKVSSLAKDDLLVLGGGRARVMTNEAAQVKAGEEAKRGEAESFEPAADLRVAASLGAESELVTALPMRLSSSAMSSLVVLGAASKSPSVVTQAAAATFTVNSAADTGDANTSNGVCADANGNCTLRAALDEIRANSSDPNAGPYTINFNVPGAGVPTIFTSQQLIPKPVLIDGTTQAAGRVEIIDGAASNGFLYIRGGNSTIRGLVISSETLSILLQSNNNIIEGCYFSTNADGTAVATRRNQTSLDVRSSNNRIGGTTAAARNVISGATFHGIEIFAGTGNLIQGNYIGTNAAGTAAIGNRVTGIRILSPGNTVGGTTAGAGNLISGNENGGGESALNFLGGNSHGLVQGNLFGTDASGNNRLANAGDALHVFFSDPGAGVTMTIGGTTPAARNIISGSNGHGVVVRTFLNDNSIYVQGNYIGTNADGTAAIPNLGHGVLMGAGGHIVGGAVAGAGNLISGNGEDGIFLGSPGHTIQGNLIGTDVSGTLALPNSGDGIETSRADRTLIGGTTPEARNVISGNRENGLRFGHVDNPANNPVRVEGNYIGLNRFGTGALGNGKHGINFVNTAGNNVGGTSTSAGNVIAFNGGDGIASENSIIGGAVLSNSIHSNAGLGIDIGDNGVSSDAVFPSARRPTLTSVTNTGAVTVITGTVPNHNSFTPYTLQFFSNTACDPSGHGEGQTLIGQTTFTPTTQNVPVNFSHTISPAVPGGTSITAVAVRQDDGNNVPGVFYTSELSNCAPLAAPPPTPVPVPLQAFAIAPNRGGDNGGIMSRISGQGFQTGATVKLTRSGQPDILGGYVRITEGRVLNVLFDITGKARGAWSVVVTNPDGSSATLADAFTVVEARAPRPWVDIVGRNVARRGAPATFTVLVGNRGNNDLYVLPVLIGGIPRDARVTLGFDLEPISRSPNAPRELEPSQIPAVIKTDSEQVVPLIIPRLTSGAVTVLRLTIEVPAAQPNFALRASVGAPLLRLVDDQSSLQGNRSRSGPSSEAVIPRQPRFNSNLPCVTSLVQNILGCISGFIPFTGDSAPCFEAVLGGANLLSTLTSLVLNPPSNGGGGAISASQLFFGLVALAYDASECAVKNFTPIGNVLDVVNCALAFFAILNDCLPSDIQFRPVDFPGLTIFSYPVITVASLDPNDKVGSTGSGGTPHYLSGEEPLRYQIFFENKPDASAPAQEVVITDQLDLTKFDLSTFSLGPIAFGDRTVTPPPGLSEWTTDVDLRPANNLITRINAKLDKQTGIVTWRFTSIDPATGQPTNEPLAGFLPPNKTAPEGEGNVFFTVMPKAELQTGAEICNGARIFFDKNPHIDTPVWLNTIDNSKPTSQVTQVVFDGCKTLTVNWAGTDTGSGIGVYNIYVSENGGPFTIWQQGVTATSAVFTGEQGKTYTFFSVARDAAGNVEDTPSIGDKTATIKDTTKPQITAPADVNAQIGAGDTSNALVIPDSTLGQAVASDSCSQVTVTRTGVPAGNSFTVGTHTITYTATDAIGNTATAIQTVTVTVNNVLPVIQLNSATYSVSEDGLRTAITVNRNGDLSLPATINYATNDQAGLTPCKVFNGMASSRCDYATTVGTLHFAAGEMSKTIYIPLVDDAYTEGSETFSIALSNATGSSLGAQSSATITINDNDAAIGNNPIADPTFFIRQHYIDFLGREPEPAGLAGWLNVYNNCGITVAQPCDRIEISSAFFRSSEFQDRGYFIYRFYSAVGKIPLYENFMPDFAKVSGFLSAQELEANKVAFVNEFMTRSDFQTKYGASADPTAYVDTLLQTVGLPNHPSRQTWMTGLINNSLTRTQVLRALVESTEVYQKYYTEAFVIMQYFGYLRRSADASYRNWIQTMNQNGGDYRIMINGFLNSAEYRQRFGQ